MLWLYLLISSIVLLLSLKAIGNNPDLHEISIDSPDDRCFESIAHGSVCLNVTDMAFKRPPVNYTQFMKTFTWMAAVTGFFETVEVKYDHARVLWISPAEKENVEDLDDLLDVKFMLKVGPGQQWTPDFSRIGYYDALPIWYILENHINEPYRINARILSLGIETAPLHGYMAETFPHSHVITVEEDPNLIMMVDRYFGLKSVKGELINDFPLWYLVSRKSTVDVININVSNTTEIETGWISPPEDYFHGQLIGHMKQILTPLGVVIVKLHYRSADLVDYHNAIDKMFKEFRKWFSTCQVLPGIREAIKHLICYNGSQRKRDYHETENFLEARGLMTRNESETVDLVWRSNMRKKLTNEPFEEN